MSAYLCGSCHLTALAGAAVDALVARPLPEIFAELLAENVRSLQFRYPDGSNSPPTETMRPCMFCERTEFSALELRKAASCYQHQASEHDGWATSRACAITDRIIADVETVLPSGFEESRQYIDCAWGIRPRHADLAPEIPHYLDTMACAVGDMLTALDTYADAQSAHQRLLVQKAIEYGHDPAFVQDTDYPEDMRRVLAATLELFVPSDKTPHHVAYNMARDIAKTAGTKLTER